MGPLHSAAVPMTGYQRSSFGWLVALITASICVVSCGDTSLPMPQSTLRARTECPPTADDQYFYPAEALVPNDPVVDRAQRRAIADYLAVSRAKSLSCGSGGEAYRVFWGGGFGVQSVVVTITPDAAVGATFGPRTGAQVVLDRNVSAPVSADAFGRLRQLLDGASFWTAKPFTDLEGEGTVWVIEGRRGDSYKVITRVTPDPALADAARMMLKLSGLPTPERMAAQ